MYRRLSHTVGAMLLLLVWISIPLLSSIHVALEEHRYCAEHERMEEGTKAHNGSADNGSLADSAWTSSEPPVSDNAVSGRQPSEESEHANCVFVDSFTIDSIRFDDAPAIDKSSATALVSWAAKPSDAVRVIALLYIAPKCSPPVAA